MNSQAKVLVIFLITLILGGVKTTHAAPYTPRALDGSTTQSIQNSIPGVLFDFVETKNYFRYVLYGYKIQNKSSGNLMSFNWKSKFWQGTVSLATRAKFNNKCKNAHK